MRIPSELVRALYDVPAYRGSMSPGARARGGWWARSPEEASIYANTSDDELSRLVEQNGSGPSVIPGQLNTRGFSVVDGGKAPYSHIPGRSIPPNILEVVAQHKGLTLEQAEKQVFKTDDIAQAVEEMGLPGVTFRNVEDSLGQPTTQYYVADPRRRRSRFAKFQDPNSEDLMASLVLSLMGGGGAAALSQRDQNGT